MRYLKLTSLFGFWTAIIALSIYFFTDNVVAFLYGYRSENFGTTFFNNQFWVVSHLIGGTAALLFARYNSLRAYGLAISVPTGRWVKYIF